jgi:hypothetical protein
MMLAECEFPPLSHRETAKDALFGQRFVSHLILYLREAGTGKKEYVFGSFFTIH